jgi:hypothetical protein
MRELRECTCLHTIALVYPTRRKTSPFRGRMSRERAIRKAEIQCITSKGVDRVKKI